MTGQWVAETSGGRLEETWSNPADGTMVGHGRLLRDGKTVFMEFLSVETTEEGVIAMYIVLGALSKGKKEPVAFELTDVTKGSATFSRAVDDFPKTIKYTKTVGGLHCLLTGPGENPKTERYTFKPLPLR